MAGPQYQLQGPFQTGFGIRSIDLKQRSKELGFATGVLSLLGGLPGGFWSILNADRRMEIPFSVVKRLDAGIHCWGTADLVPDSQEFIDGGHQVLGFDTNLLYWVLMGE